MAAFSLGLSAKLVMRFGFRTPLATGLLLSAVGLVLFARAPVDGSFAVDVLPSMILLGFGAGMAFNPMLLAAMSGVEQSEAGLASGIVNTAFMMGGALGLAVLASLAASRSDSLLASGDNALVALNGGYHAAFLVAAVFAVAAALVSAVFLRTRASAPGTKASKGWASPPPRRPAKPCSTSSAKRISRQAPTGPLSSRARSTAPTSRSCSSTTSPARAQVAPALLS